MRPSTGASLPRGSRSELTSEPYRDSPSVGHGRPIDDGRSERRAGGRALRFRQTVHGLEPGATFELMAMFRVPEGGDGALARRRVRRAEPDQ